MFGNKITSTLSLSKIIGGINKALSIANQAIPLYEQLKPILKNGRKLIDIVSIMNKKEDKEEKKEENKETKIIKETTTKKEESNNNNLPTFFQ